MIGAVFTVLLGYLLGCIPSGYIAGRLFKGVDVRELGDGNMGAANVYREIGPRAGFAVGLADIGKGTMAILVANSAGVAEAAVLLCGVAAVVGHNWPVFLRFRGGRGASTAIGVLTVLLPREMSILWAAASVPFVMRMGATVSCGVMFVPLPLAAWWLGAPASLIAYSVALPSLVGFTHFLTTRQPVPRAREGEVQG